MEPTSASTAPSTSERLAAASTRTSRICDNASDWRESSLLSPSTSRTQRTGPPGWTNLTTTDSRLGYRRKKDEVQVRTLLYTMGRKSRKILRSLNVKDEEMEVFKLVKSKFNDYFVHTKNIVYESARFNVRHQQLGETVDQFVTELSKLGDRCEFSSMKERLIRDRFVVRLRDQVLSEELQMDPKLTMATAWARLRRNETVKQQQAELKEHEGTVPEACVPESQESHCKEHVYSLSEARLSSK
ncbi:hypothetical protein MRX96_019821 [Rhipicephalus microplus]